MSRKELKPCPFCGGSVEYWGAVVEGESDHICHVGGSHCGLDQFSSFNTEQSVEVAWNTRASPVPQAVREALAEIEKGAGTFDMDPLKHASNCIEEMKEHARRAIALLDGEGEKE